MPRPTTRPTSTVARWRAGLAAALTGALAVIGAVAGVAAPAAAKNAPLEVMAIVGCSTGDDGTGALRITPSADANYVWSVTGEEYSAGGTVAGSAFIDVEVALNGLAPGPYHAVVEEEGNGGVPDPHSFAEADFTVEACIPDLGVAITGATCSTGDDAVMTLELSGLVVGTEYRWWVAGFSGSLLADAATAQIPLSSGTPPGNYLAYAETVDDSPVYDWIAFAIEPCQPTVELAVTQCSVAGGTGTVDVSLAHLVHGVAYTVTGPDGSTQQATAQPSGVTTLTFPSIAAGTTATVSVTGTWTVDEPYEEPPYIGGGNFVPLDTVVLAGSADAALTPCPAPPSAPSKPAALAESGPGDVTGAATVALLLMAMGGSVVLSRRGVRRPE
ncbi:hypothetical protein ACFPER_08295 [Agromyces aurantiacus]|uniref:LPXTG cell wall anchor domain-containing protein n=1 Tax=Agromyces aurantiacus TaxID=165814 RepID=A0ABV9R678_9MICO|nr:hypothetical protein [Agromyces aurantiacus]MBM7503467.1 hypothetical protein [Agromyces aurantiacus]